MKNWKTFSLCNFTQIPQKTNVSNNTNILIFVAYCEEISRGKKNIVADYDSP